MHASTVWGSGTDHGESAGWLDYNDLDRSHLGIGGRAPSTESTTVKVTARDKAESAGSLRRRNDCGTKYGPQCAQPGGHVDVSRVKEPLQLEAIGGRHE